MLIGKIVTAARAGARTLHGRLIFNRRVSVLARILADLLPPQSKVLDIGCGSGDVAAAIMKMRADLTIRGVDVLVREEPAIPVQRYDGRTLPFAADEVDICMLVDVLHHTDDPQAVLEEAKRVSRLGVVLKDHFRDGAMAGPTLRLMDWIGNAPHGVRLNYNYLSRSEWALLWGKVGMMPCQLADRVPLYPRPLSAIFGRRLHFTVFLKSL